MSNRTGLADWIRECTAEYPENDKVWVNLSVKDWRAVEAALRQSQNPDRDAGEGMREACAKVCEERAAYFDRAPGYREWADAARSYRATASEIRALSPEGKP